MQILNCFNRWISYLHVKLGTLPRKIFLIPFLFPFSSLQQHAILKPFMLRRVKKDVITELTGKTEIAVHCKLSSRQQAFYQAIKNKISLSELFDSNRGHLNEKRILNLMNIVIQLRKVIYLIKVVFAIIYFWNLNLMNVLTLLIKVYLFLHLDVVFCFSRFLAM